MTAENGYAVSHDYDVLWALIQDAGARVLCFVDYDRGHAIRDVAQARMSGDLFQVGARGTCYVWAQDADDFKRQCVSSGVAFIPPASPIQEPVADTREQTTWAEKVDALIRNAADEIVSRDGHMSTAADIVCKLREDVAALRSPRGITVEEVGKELDAASNEGFGYSEVRRIFLDRLRPLLEREQ